MAPTVKQGENLRRLRNCPVVIICGRPSEAEAIAKALGIYENRLSSHEVAEVHNNHIFYYGHFDLIDGTKLGYVLTSSTRQGIQSFTVQAAILAHILRPRFFVHAGVCAGRNSGKIKVGDVILGESAFNFEEGKFKVAKDGQVVFVPDYHRVSVWTGDMQAFADDDARPGYHYGDYITGSAVREDANIIFERVSSQVGRNVIALDMEASAFLELCNYFMKESNCLGIVKGVSDLGDEKKGHDPADKQNALINTAHALKEWITKSIPAKTWEDDYSREPAAEIAPAYYDNFIRKVMDNVSQGLAVTRKHSMGQPFSTTPINVSAIKGLMVVMPKDNNPVEYKGGAISSVCNKHSITEVEIGGDYHKRGLYYRSGYLIDFPRIVNRYADSYDGGHQVMVFGELLKKKEWFHASSDGLRATLVSWEDLIKFLGENEVEEVIHTPARETSPENTNGSGRGQSRSESPGKRKPFFKRSFTFGRSKRSGSPVVEVRETPLVA